MSIYSLIQEFIQDGPIPERAAIRSLFNAKTRVTAVPSSANKVGVDIVLNDNCYKAPERKREGDIGYDCYSAEDVTIHTGQIAKIDLGFRLRPPTGYGVFIIPRGGLGSKGITIANTPGLGDPNFTGTYKAITINHSPNTFNVRRGDRICQLVIMPVPTVLWNEVDELPETNRGENAYGSSGLNG